MGMPLSTVPAWGSLFQLTKHRAGGAQVYPICSSAAEGTEVSTCVNACGSVMETPFKAAPTAWEGPRTGLSVYSPPQFPLSLPAFWASPLKSQVTGSPSHKHYLQRSLLCFLWVPVAHSLYCLPKQPNSPLSFHNRLWFAHPNYSPIITSQSNLNSCSLGARKARHQRPLKTFK